MYTELSRRLYNSNLKLSKLVLNEPCDLLAEYKIFKTIKSLLDFPHPNTSVAPPAGPPTVAASWAARHKPLVQDSEGPGTAAAGPRLPVPYGAGPAAAAGRGPGPPPPDPGPCRAAHQSIFLLASVTV